MKKNKTERLIDTKYNINSSQEDRDQYEDDVDEKKLRKTQQTFKYSYYIIYLTLILNINIKIVQAIVKLEETRLIVHSIQY